MSQLTSNYRLLKCQWVLIIILVCSPLYSMSLGSHVRICKGVTIGDSSIAAACSDITKYVSANCIVAGNPAKVVKTDIDKLPEPVFP